MNECNKNNRSDVPSSIRRHYLRQANPKIQYTDKDSVKKDAGSKKPNSNS